MKRFSRLLALALPVLWGCTSERLTPVEPPSAAPPVSISAAANGIPLVYDVENTGANLPTPTFPSFAALPSIPLLPDPFRPINGGAPDLSFASWQNRRNEFKAAIEAFEIGPKPDPSDVDVSATFVDKPSPAVDTLYVEVTRRSNGRTLRLASPVSLPSGSGPFSAVIGMNSLNGSIPADIFTSRDVARIAFRHNDVTTYFGKNASNPFYLMYPEYAATGTHGQYAAWSWGISRLIDGLQLLARQADSPLPINVSRLAVTGCSYAGKMALFSGAMDERIALTIAQESGGGGAPAWRVSHAIEPNGTVEKTDNTDNNWFSQGVLKTFFRGDSVYKLPHDHHSLMAMVAPRALLVTGNTDFIWLSNRATYVTARATHEVYKTLGIGDRFGFYIDGQHGHCAIPATQRPAIEAFVDKFLLDRDVNTNIQVHPYPTLDYAQWTPWADRTATVQQVTMDVQPGQISVGSTAVVNVVLHGAADFDATAVDAANVRLVVNGSVNDTQNPPGIDFVPPVAPIMRGAAANTSVADVNGDGHLDRVIGFSTSALRAVGYAPGYSTLWLRPATAPYAWQAFDVTGTFVTRPRVVP